MIHTKKRTRGCVVVLLATSTTYRPYVLDDTICDFETILVLVRKGTKEGELHGKYSYIHRTDAIGYYIVEKAGGTYYFKEGKFHHLSISD